MTPTFGPAGRRGFAGGGLARRESEIKTMKPFEECPVCDGALKRRQLEKRLGGGDDMVSLQVRVEVCLHCGARLYAEDMGKSFAVIRVKSRKKAFSHFRTRAC